MLLDAEELEVAAVDWVDGANETGADDRADGLLCGGVADESGVTGFFAPCGQNIAVITPTRISNNTAGTAFDLSSFSMSGGWR